MLTGDSLTIHSPLDSILTRSPMLVLSALCVLACSASDDVGDSSSDEDESEAAATDADGELDAEGGEKGSNGCVSSTATTPECEYPGPGFGCPHPDHVCGFVGANKQTMVPTCVCLEDPDACFPPVVELECGGNEDCDGSGDASCVDGACVCNP